MRRIVPFLILLAAQACGTAPQPAANAPRPATTNAPPVAVVDPNQPARVSAAELAQAFETDAAACRTTYLGRDLELSGVVEEIVLDPKDPNHVIGLNLAAVTTGKAKGTLPCLFPEQKQVKKGDLKVTAGGPVTLKGALIANAKGLEIRITTLY